MQKQKVENTIEFLKKVLNNEILREGINLKELLLCIIRKEIKRTALIMNWGSADYLPLEWIKVLLNDPQGEEKTNNYLLKKYKERIRERKENYITSILHEYLDVIRIVFYDKYGWNRPNLPALIKDYKLLKKCPRINLNLDELMGYSSLRETPFLRNPIKNCPPFIINQQAPHYLTFEDNPTIESDFQKYSPYYWNLYFKKWEPGVKLPYHPEVYKVVELFEFCNGDKKHFGYVVLAGYTPVVVKSFYQSYALSERERWDLEIKLKHKVGYLEN